MLGGVKGGQLQTEMCELENAYSIRPVDNIVLCGFRAQLGKRHMPSALPGKRRVQPTQLLIEFADL